MDFQVIITKIMENPITSFWLTVIGLGLGVLGLIASTIFYFKGRKYKAPRYAIRSSNLISGQARKVAPLSVSYRRKPITNFTVSKIAFWNDGNETIHGADITEIEPLIIQISDSYEILDTEIIYRRNSANQFRCIPQEYSSVLLQFEYLDKFDGVIIQVLHTGLGSEDLSVCGKIKGVGQVNKEHSKSHMTSKLTRIVLRIVRRTLFINKMIPVTALILVPLGIPIVALNSSRSITKFDVAFIMITIVLYWGQAYLMLRKNVPKGYDMFEEKFFNHLSSSESTSALESGSAAASESEQLKSRSSRRGTRLSGKRKETLPQKDE